MPLFMADIVLAIPSIVLKPGLDDIQQTVNKAVQTILHMAQDIPPWEQTIIAQKAALKVCVVLGQSSGWHMGITWVACG